MSTEWVELSLYTAVFSAFLIGVSFGSGPCNLSCLPYLGPVLLGPSAAKPVAEVLLPFMGGRLSGYLTLGAAAGAFGQTLQHYLEHPAVPLFAASITFWLALKMWRQARQPVCHSVLPSAVPEPPASNLIATDRAVEPRNRLQLYGLGFSLALNPCIPLLGLLAVAAQSASWFWGGAVAFGFGIGAIVIPTLLVRYGVALLGKELRRHLVQWQFGLTRVGAGLLLLVAINTAWRGVPA